MMKINKFVFPFPNPYKSNPVSHFPADSSSPYKCLPFKTATQKFISLAGNENVLNYQPTNLIRQRLNEKPTGNIGENKINEVNGFRQKLSGKYKKYIKAGLIILSASALALMAIKGYNKLSVKQISSSDKIIPADCNNYRSALAKGLEKHLGIKIEPESLSCVKDKDEFLNIIKSLKRENYVYTPENIANGIFKADLHSHSNYSDGKACVKDILDQAAKYGDELFEKTKSNFTFALSDHDGVGGVIEALSVIAKNPDKFKHINFIPAAELSFAHLADKSSNPAETSEVLAFCINPFSETLRNMLKELHSKRFNMINNFINEIKNKFPDVKFSTEEFSKIYNTDMTKDMFSMNLHWRVHHYGQTKLAVTRLAESELKDPEKYYSEIMSKASKGKALGNLKDMKLVPYDVCENQSIINIRKSFEPHLLADNTFKVQSENTVDEICNAFKSDNNVLLALAHPFYITERTNHPENFINYLKDKFKGKLIATESYHQAYKNIDSASINSLNELCEKKGLIPIGGRDNHLKNFL